MRRPLKEERPREAPGELGEALSVFGLIIAYDGTGISRAGCTGAAHGSRAIRCGVDNIFRTLVRLGGRPDALMCGGTPALAATAATSLANASRAGHVGDPPLPLLREAGRFRP